MKRAVFLLFLAGATATLPWVGEELLHTLPPVRRVEVEGCRQVSVREIRKQLEPMLKGKSLLEVDLGEMALHLRSHPFIKECEIWMVPPDGLRVRIVERRPVAVLHYKAESLLVDETGVAFVKTGGTWNLPQLKGISPDDRRGICRALETLKAFEGSPLGQVEEIEVHGEVYLIRTSRGLLLTMERDGVKEEVRALEAVWQFLKAQGRLPRYFLCEGGRKVVAGFEKGANP